MNVLLIGSGGREHAIAWKLRQSSRRLRKLYIVPGNAGTAEVGENIPIEATDIAGLLRFAKQNKIDFTVVGPDDPLGQGIVDVFQGNNLQIFGPQILAAQVETSKAHAKRLMEKHGIPTASFQTFQVYDEALRYVLKHGAPIVVKASGLALGKGARPCRTIEEAKQALHEIMVERVYGEAGKTVVIEDYLEGQEISIHALVDWIGSFRLFPPSQDHKRVFDGDQGPMTGGMGTITPVPWVTDALLEHIKTAIVEKFIAAIHDDGCRFVGCLYPGLMITDSGPKVLEWNARFGDPETQSYIRLFDPNCDLLELLLECLGNGVSHVSRLRWSPGFAANIVLASGGYPGSYKKGFPISGIKDAEKVPGVVVFHAGTARKDGELITNGGRVLGVSATGATLAEALARAYEGVKRIHFEGMHYRKDIGQRSLALVPA